MSPLGFKVTVGSLIHTWWRHTCYTFSKIHRWCDTCQPLSSQHGSWATLFHVPLSRHWWGSKPWSILPPMDAPPTELCRLGCFWMSLLHHHHVSSRIAVFCVIIFRVQTIGREHGRKRIRTKTAITNLNNSWDVIPSYIDIRPTFLVNDVNCDDQLNGLLIN